MYMYMLPPEPTYYEAPYAKKEPHSKLVVAAVYPHRPEGGPGHAKGRGTSWLYLDFFVIPCWVVYYDSYNANRS